MVQQLLGTLNSNRALSSDQARQLDRLVQGSRLAVEDVADEADLLGFGRAKLSRRHAHLLHPREVADGLGQPGKGANVGGQADVDLLDGQPDVTRAEPDVGGAGDVDGEAEGDGVEDDDDGFGGFGRLADEVK